ncbi:MAG TPA: hypothetical protein VE727_02340, partial [Solirubrobacterales bacterium]|nr:hypothetical protein [Solirubrobacterales bacterium]
QQRHLAGEQLFNGLELGWGSAPPDGSGYNKGPSGQRQMLIDSFQLVLNHHAAWNVPRLFWFLWRDPAPGLAYANRCPWCSSGDLLYYGRARKESYYAIKYFAAQTTP